MVKATNLAERNLDRVRKEPKLNLPPSYMNHKVNEEDIHDEGELLNWDGASSLQKTYG